MKFLFSVTCIMVLSFLATSCATSPDKSRAPASEIKVLSDKYGDARVYFCSPEVAVVTIDPNRCNEVRATRPGSICAELASYTSKPLKVVSNGKGWNLTSVTGTVEFAVASANNQFRVTSTSKKNFDFPMAWYNLTAQDIELFKYMPVCPN